jgi:cytoskeletal protein CcmA (bactofilin family)
MTHPVVADWFAERNVMEGQGRIAGSFRLDTRELDHLGPFLGLAATGAMSRIKLSIADGFCLTFRAHFLLSFTRAVPRGVSMSMFTRNSSGEPTSLDPLKPISKADPGRPPQLHRMESGEAGKSVISNDLKIIGQGLKIISRGTLQVDGEVEGDVAGAEIIIGEQGKVTGTVAAERVIVRGRTSGVIRAMTVALQASARVEGDIHHMSLAIEEGAEFDGRCLRPANTKELQPDLDEHS